MFFLGIVYAYNNLLLDESVYSKHKLNCLTGKYKDANVNIQGTPKIVKRVKIYLRLFHCLFARFKAFRGLN